MDEKQIARINELAKKAKTPEGLTPEEIEEQKLLRLDYVMAIRNNLKSQLNNIDIEEPDGTVVNLGEKYDYDGKKED